MLGEPNMLYAKCFAFLLYLTIRTRTDTHKRITKLENLLKTHQKLGQDLDFYIKHEEKRLSFIRRYLDMFEREHVKAMKDIPSYVGNPINAVTLIKRLTLDVHYIKNHIKDGSDSVQNIMRHHKNLLYPDSADLKEAAKALNRFRIIYKVDINELAEGKLNSIVYSSPMTASDCYELGRALFDAKDFESGLEWMFQALRKYKDEEPLNHEFIASVYKYISLGNAELGDFNGGAQGHDPDDYRTRIIALEYKSRNVANASLAAVFKGRD